MTAGASSTDTRFRADLLIRIQGALLLGLFRVVENRHQPDREEGSRHREQRGGVVQEPGRALRILQHGFHTEAEPMVSTEARIRPTKPPTTAPLVVQFFHSTDMNRTGKLPEQAIVKASITM